MSNTKELKNKQDENIKIGNVKSSLLVELKKFHSAIRLSKLKEFIKDNKLANFKLIANDLAFTYLFPEQDRLDALKLLKQSNEVQSATASLDFSRVLIRIKGCKENQRLEKIQALTQQYPLNLANADLIAIKKLFSFFPEKDLFELIKIPIIWKKIIKINFAQEAKRPALPINLAETVKLLTKLKVYTPVFDFQEFLKKFSTLHGKYQVNSLLQLDNSRILTRYLKTSGNITELFRWIPDKSVFKYLELPPIKLAIDKALFSWSDIENLAGADQQTIYFFSKFLAEKNKLSQAITNLKQLELLLKMLPHERRFEFLQFTTISNIFKSKALDITDLKNFIELFPSSDALKFIESPWIKNRIDHLGQLNSKLSKSAHADILTYFPFAENKQKVEKLLNPITPIANKAKLSVGFFRVAKQSPAIVYPDLISSHVMVQTKR